jgi:transcriptional regulator with XRE-family HTH domain
MSSIGKRVAALRTARGLSQAELARRIKIAQPSLHDIESGKTKTLRGETLANLCRELNVQPDAILKGTTGNRPETLLLESELIATWRSLSEADQEHLMAIARALASARPKPPAPEKERRKRFATTGAGDLTRR